MIFGLIWFMYKSLSFSKSLAKVNHNSFGTQAAIKTIGEEDKYFSKVSLRSEYNCIICFPVMLSSCEILYHYELC